MSFSRRNLDKLLHLWSQFLHLYNGDNNSTNFLESLEALNKLMMIRHLEQYPLEANKCSPSFIVIIIVVVMQSLRRSNGDRRGP